jgi:8-oxo-dGTP pyrophosphatase MutT (NUDIX family)
MLRSGRILLVRARANTVWYLPGGKIGHGETAERALARELLEELTMEVHPSAFTFLKDIVAPNHDKTDTVYLQAFTLPSLPEYRRASEISEVQWIDVVDRHLMAPAVVRLLEELENEL